MDAVGTVELLQRAIARIERQRGRLVARQQASHIGQQRKVCALDDVHRRGFDRQRLLGQPQHGRLGSAQHARPCRQADEGEHTADLVELRRCLLQRLAGRRVAAEGGGAVVAALADEAAQSLVH